MENKSRMTDNYALYICSFCLIYTVHLQDGRPTGYRVEIYLTLIYWERRKAVCFVGPKTVDVSPRETSMVEGSQNILLSRGSSKYKK